VRVTRLFRTILGFARSVVAEVTIEAEGPIEVQARPTARRARCGGCGRKGKSPVCQREVRHLADGN